MIDIDYTINFKSSFKDVKDFATNSNYDLFLSSFNDSERVKSVFNGVNSKSKHWLVFPEYQYSKEELPPKSDGYEIFEFSGLEGESDIIREYFKTSIIDASLDVCIDITGFIRPHLIFLLRYLKAQKFKKIDFVYTDPISYKKKENTEFALDYVDVRSVNGCEGMHNPDTSNDLLIIGSGYDEKRIADVSKSKGNARKVQVFGFPSLQPDMYQENILKAYKAEESSTGGEGRFIEKNTTILSPANNPFVTAQKLSEFYKSENRKKEVTNLYLSPLSTKAQTLGFALFYVSECIGTPTSIIFPYCSSYSRETTIGVSKVWRYTVEFD